MIFTFILLFISIFIGQYISYNILLSKNNTSLNVLAISFIILIFIIFAYLTFNPINNDIFWDPKNETYEKVTRLK
jgi:formate hydrogenlyase subunit 3/multisubunit Na+/H+ antiporter MnhD subunit